MVVRSALGALIFLLVMALPVLGRVATGQDPAEAVFSWLTPLALGLALLPTHPNLARLILWSFGFVTGLTLIVVSVLAVMMFAASSSDLTVGHYISEIGTGFGALIQIACALFVVPILLVRDRRLSSGSDILNIDAGRFVRGGESG
ncbi:hypothetical protein [Maricaulis sp.]|uniref:hypothetical protein n=1 Tax=Maricaulis sp. TaxID=1486257 RepID=UPI0025EF2DBA|nr:hypothetical protein [Maricaulis sp.]MDF1769372.1 hypothetical protein [Maricaulis sp.]